MKEYKIGETFNIGRKKFQVVKGSGCYGCDFDNYFSGFCCDLQDDFVGSCRGTKREDKESVVFKLIEE